MSATVTPLPWLQNDALFRSECAEGHAWERWIAQLFALHGLDVELPEQEIREDVADRGRFRGSKDLVVAGRVIEVKTRKMALASAFDPLFVSSVDKWAAINPKPFAMVIVFREDVQIRAIPGALISRSKIVDVPDRVRGESCPSHAIPKRELRTLDRLIRALRTGKER